MITYLVKYSIFDEEFEGLEDALSFIRSLRAEYGGNLNIVLERHEKLEMILPWEKLL